MESANDEDWLTSLGPSTAGGWGADHLGLASIDGLCEWLQICIEDFHDQHAGLTYDVCIAAMSHMLAMLRSEKKVAAKGQGEHEL